MEKLNKTEREKREREGKKREGEGGGRRRREGERGRMEEKRRIEEAGVGRGERGREWGVRDREGGEGRKRGRWGKRRQGERTEANSHSITSSGLKWRTVAMGDTICSLPYESEHMKWKMTFFRYSMFSVSRDLLQEDIQFTCKQIE